MEARTLRDAILEFADEDHCIETLRDIRWPDGKPVCPTCGRNDATYVPARRVWQCKSRHAKRAFSVKTGTIFEASPISMSKWLPAVWLLSSNKNGISSYELGKALGVTQKSAWFMLSRIRLGMQAEDGGMLDGVIEVDETFIGGLALNMHAPKRKRLVHGTGGTMSGKTVVLGLLDRHGADGHSTVRTRIVENVRTKDLMPVVQENVRTGAEVMTDAHHPYKQLSPLGYVHGFVNHAEKYVEGQIHTNAIESYWSLLKRALKGTYISVEPFHLYRYLDEQAFRFNTRKLPDAERIVDALKGTVGKRLTYDALIHSDR